jgi:small-conductance mechanosensitive channel
MALGAGLGTSAVLLTLIGVLRRRLRLVREMSLPLSLGAIAGGLKVFLTLTGEEFGSLAVRGGGRTLDEILSWLLLLVIFVLGVKLVGLYIFEIRLHSKGVRLPDLLPKVAYAIAYFVVALITLKMVAPDLDLGPLLATSAVTSLVLGLALQPILGNFFAGLVISLERPFRINDWILYEGTEARVVGITWRTVQLRNRDNDTLVVPNSKIAGEDIINYFYPHPLHMERIYVGAHYRHPPYLVKTAMLDAARRAKGVLDKPSAQVYLAAFGDSSITYELRAWIEDFAEKPAILNRVKSGIWEEFRRHNLTIPFPIRTLELEPRVNRLAVEQVEHEETTGLLPAGRLMITDGTQRGLRCALGTGSMLIGRSDECDLTLDEPRASSKHASIEWIEDSGYILKDLGSQNGTKVNRGKVTEHHLTDMDRIEIADTIIVFQTHE